MKTATQTHRKPAAIREEIRTHLKEAKQFVKAVTEGTPEYKTYKELTNELKEAEQHIKENDMFLFIEAQNLVNKHLNKVTPEAQSRIKTILGEKFLNMDNSRTHKHINLFKGLEGETTKETKRYKYRLNIKFVNRDHLYLDISIHIWNETGSRNYSDNKMLCSFENGTSLKELVNPTGFKIFNTKTELKKLKKYEEQKKKLQAIKDTLNTPFVKAFLYDFERDNY